MKVATQNGTAPAQAPPRVNALARVTKGRLARPQRVLVYGAEGVGKSTFASGAPRPIFLGAEGGTLYLDVARLPEPRTWDEALDALRDVRREPHDYETIVVDPLNWLQPLCWDAVSGGGRIEDACGGFGKGYQAAHDLWRVMLRELDGLWRERSMHVVLIAHAALARFENTTGLGYDHWVPALHMSKKINTVGLFAQWVDHVLYVAVETHATRGADDRVIGVSTGRRVAHAAPSGGWMAKGRMLPPELELSWAAFYEAATRGQEVESLLERVDPETRERARGFLRAGADVGEVLAKLKEKVTK